MGRRASGPYQLQAPRGGKAGACWKIRFSLNGRQYERSTGCRDKATARRAAAKIYAEAIEAASSIARTQTDLASLVVSWLTHLASTNRSQEWRDKLETYTVPWLARWQQLEHITSASIQDYIAERLSHPGRGGRRLSPVTLHKELVGLNLFLRWCAKQGHLRAVPVWDAPRPKSDYRALCLSADDVERILAALPDRLAHPKRHPVREYYTVMWLTAWRRATMARLLWSDVDPVTGVVHIRPSADKARFGRDLQLPQRAISALSALPKKDGPVFGWRDYRVALQAAALAAGIPEADVPRISNHTLRHSRLTYVAHATKNIAAVAYFAGHKHLSTTDRYMHAGLASARSLLADLGEAAPEPDSAPASALRGELPRQRRPKPE